MSLAPTSHTQADSPPSSPVLGPARDGRLGPFDPSPRAPASAPTHPTLGIRLEHLHSQTLALQEKKDLLDNGHGVPEHRIALQTHVACLAVRSTLLTVDCTIIEVSCTARDPLPRSNWRFGGRRSQHCTLPGGVLESLHLSFKRLQFFNMDCTLLHPSSLPSAPFNGTYRPWRYVHWQTWDPF
jgi:hypothetical protein